MGVAELAIHTIPTQVIWVTFMVPFGIGVALSIRLGETLPRSVRAAKQLAVGCWVVSAVLFGAMSLVMYTQRHSVYTLFTHELAVIEGAEEIWWKVTFYFFNLSIFGINIGIVTGLGLQWTLGAITLFSLWVVGLPAAYYFAIVKGGGLNAAWSCVWPPYVAMNSSRKWPCVRSRERCTNKGLTLASVTCISHVHLLHDGLG
jgi:multidrug resistance protein, MATE family